MRGRHPAGPEYVEQLQGSAQAKERLRLILETMTGQRRVQEVCRLLAISEQRFDQLRTELLQAALASLESKPIGRPSRPPPDTEAQTLRQQVAALQAELAASQVREEIAVILQPQESANAAATPPAEKKTTCPKRRARPGWWRR